MHIGRLTDRFQQFHAPEPQGVDDALTQPLWVYYIPCMARFVRKSVLVDPTALRCAQKILRTPTESETIREALDLVAFRRSVLKEYDRVAGKAPDFPDPWTDA